LQFTEHVKMSSQHKAVYLCQKCLNHNVQNARKDHKTNCRFANCNCAECKMIDSRRELNNLLKQLNAENENPMRPMSRGNLKNYDFFILSVTHYIRTCAHLSEVSSTWYNSSSKTAQIALPICQLFLWEGTFSCSKLRFCSPRN
jgi:hypothetical protein